MPLRLGADRGGETDMTFALPHWLFWAAMCLRELDDVDGLARIRAVLAASRPRGNNLVLTDRRRSGRCCVPARNSGTRHRLNRAILRWHLWRPVSLPSSTRYAPLARSPNPDLRNRPKALRVALARRGDFDDAIKVAAAINSDLEEQARALFRITHTALAAGDVAAARQEQ